MVLIGNFWELKGCKRVDRNIWSNSSWMSDACNGTKIHFRIARQKIVMIPLSLQELYTVIYSLCPLNNYLNNQPCSQHFSSFHSLQYRGRTEKRPWKWSFLVTFSKSSIFLIWKLNSFNSLKNNKTTITRNMYKLHGQFFLSFNAI